MSPSPTLDAPIRRALARPQARRALVGLLALATAAAVAALVGSAAAARQRWGATRPVAVATRDLAAGEAVAGAVAVRRWPAALVPPAALARPPAGAVARHPVATGEPLVPAHLAPDGLTGAAALVPAGSRAVAVPLAPVAAPPLAVGDLVDLVGVLPEGGGFESGGPEPAFPLAEGAPVVDVGDATASVAVPEADVPRVAYALAQGAVVVTLAGG
ncbi:MAG TPA: SAF domain-containing protein [Acidimicrobiales bacterium]